MVCDDVFSACFSFEPEEPQDKPVLRSDVLKMVKELDDEKKGPGSQGSPGRPSDKTGRTQTTAPWMKTSGVRSAYNIYRRVDTDTTDGQAVRQAAVAGSTRPAGVTKQRAQPAPVSNVARPAVAGSRTQQPASTTSSRAPTFGVHSPMGYKPVTPKTSPGQPSGQGQPSSCMSEVQSRDDTFRTQGPQQPAALDAPPVTGFRSVSSVFGSEAKSTTVPSSVLDKNFNMKPRGFRSVAPPVPAQQSPSGTAAMSSSSSLRQRASPFPAPAPVPLLGTGSPATAPDTGPGYSGSMMFTSPIWSDRTSAQQESSMSQLPHGELAQTSSGGTEAHGTDTTDFAYKPHPSNSTGTNNYA